ncbi:MAG TPA: hypothetical protein VJZ71_08820 [Phycisphaerae bacterium]|nr:hypothetical protein [Phycisphaerae bacterium]
MKRIAVACCVLALNGLADTLMAQAQDAVRSDWPEQGPPPEKAREPLPPDQYMLTPRANVLVVDVAGASGFNLANRNLGGEPSIAVNPVNPQQIVILSFAGSFWDGGREAPMWVSNNGGLGWGQYLSIPEPRSPVGDNCPCDQTPDFGQNGVFYATFLRVGGGNAIYTGQSTNPTNPASWSWNPANVALPSVPTNSFGAGQADQPWLWTGRDPTNAGQTNVYVAYDDFSAFSAVAPFVVPGRFVIRNTASLGASPPNFPGAQDLPVNLLNQPMQGTNPGNRITVDSLGTVYNIHGKSVSPGAGAVKLVTYIVNRSTNAGATWTIPGGGAPGGGIVVAMAPSRQGTGFKMGDPTGGANGNNTLLGNITAIAVDPNTQVVYTSYGLLDPVNNLNWLVVRRLIPAGGGAYTIGPAFIVSTANQDHALPCLAVLNSGEVGLLFTRYHPPTDSYDVRLHQSSTAFATSTTLTSLVNFNNFVAPSPMAPSGAVNDRQRILGDYQQLKANGNRYYGTFAARGAGGLNSQSVVPYFVRADGDAPQANQACCLPSGLCRDLPPASCQSINGVPQGVGTACVGTQCGAAGACCLGGGVCNIQTRANCVAAGGAFQGTGSACAAAEACYLPNGTCLMLSPVCCNSQGGVPQGPGSACAANERCCLPNGTCANADPTACWQAGGTPGGAGSACGGNQLCVLPDGSCLNTDPICCAAAGGAAGGAGSACAANERCCLPEGNCLNTDPIACGAVGGAAGGAGTACGATQACCFPSGGCLNLDPVCCANAGGTAGGGGTSCTATRRCCLPGGGCSNLDPVCCAQAGGTAGGAGSACSNITACCTGGGANCQNTDPVCCAMLPGGQPNDSGLPCLGDLSGNTVDDACDCLCLGDTNGGGFISTLDIPSLTDAVLGIVPSPCADVNFDGFVNGQDIRRFTDLLMAGTTCGP